MIKCSKYFILPWVFLIIGFQANGQFFVQAGYNHSDFQLSVQAMKMPTLSTPGFHAGIGYEADLIGNGISLNPVVVYSQKGIKMDFAEYSVSDRLNFIDISLLLSIKVSLADQFHLFMNTGPFVGGAIGGTSTAQGETTLYIGSTSKDHYRFLNYGFSVGTGIGFQSFVLGVQYQLGMRNILTNPGNNAVIKTGVYSLSVAYLFGVS